MSTDSVPALKPLKIAMFTEAYPPIVSGVAVATRTLVEGLREAGHEVDVYAPHHPEQAEDEQGVTRLPSVPVPLPGWIPISIPLTPLAFKDIAAKGYDIAHTQHPFLLGAVARALARRVDIPLVATVHTQYEQYVHYWTPWHEPGRWIVRQIIREFCNTCDHIVTVAAGMEALLREYGVSGPIEVIPNDIDLGDFMSASGEGVREALGIAAGEVFLLSVSRLGSEKNLMFMLESVAPMLQARNARLVFVGDGPLRLDLERKAVEIGGGKVLFAGKLPHEETARYYAAADIFLMTSVTEVNPLTIGESLAAGTPVVAVDSFSAREGMVDMHDGLIAPQDADAYRHAVTQLVDDCALRARMARTARETARRRACGTATERTLALYASLAGKGHCEATPAPGV